MHCSTLALEIFAGDLVALTFTQLDASSYHRTFSFDLDLAHDAYTVPSCAPSLPSTVVQALVATLNESKDLSAFIKAMREAFVQHALGASASQTRRAALDPSR
jgi:hypothetical protein